MKTNEVFGRITVNPEVMAGKPTIRGFRITVEQILKALAANISISDLLEDYPELEPEDIKAVQILNSPANALRMLRDGLPVEAISKYTGLTGQQVKALVQ